MEKTKRTFNRTKVSAGDLIILLQLNSDESFNSKKGQSKKFKNIPIERLTADQINRKRGFQPPSRGKTYSAIFDSEITGDINLAQINENIEHPVLFFNCKLGKFQIFGNNRHSDVLYFFDCEISDILLKDISIEALTLDLNTRIENIEALNCKIKKLEFFNVNAENINLSNVLIDVLRIYNSSNLREILNIENSEILFVDIYGLCTIGPIFLNSCKINRFLIQEKCEVGNFVFEESSRISDFELIGSKAENINLNNVNVGDFKITNTELAHIKIYNESTITTFVIRKCRAVGDLEIENRSKLGNIYITGCNTGDLRFKRSEINYLYFHDSYCGIIKIGKSNFGNIWISHNCKVGDIFIDRSKTGFINANNQFFSLIFSEAIIPLLHADNCKIQRLDVSMGSILEAYFSGCALNYISFSKTCLSSETKISFSECLVFLLQFDEFSSLGYLFFRKIQPALEFYDWWWSAKNPTDRISSLPYKNKSIFIDAKKDYLLNKDKLKKDFERPTIRLYHSTLGKTEFTNCQLGDFNFEYNNSKITECFISGGTVPDDNIVIIDDYKKSLLKNNKESFNQKASFFNQLKKIFEEQGDAFRAAQFQAKWSEHQRKYLQLEYSVLKGKATLILPWKRLKLILGELSQDIGIFRLNRWSSNHGESWIRALGFTIITTGFFYVMFLWSIGRCFNSNGIDWSLVGYYFEFLTPTFKPDFITGERPSSGSIGLYYAGKAVFAYGLYQFIAAFRKHGRKK